MTWVERISQLPRATSLLLGFSLIALVAWGDHQTGEHFSFSFFYLPPILLVGWCNGRRVGMLFSVFCAMLWMWVDLVTRAVFPGWFVELWNTSVRLGVFGLVTFGMAAIRRAFQRERLLGRTDPLTSLANSRYFMERLDAEVQRAARYGHPFSLAYVDLDNFKQVNDRFGHREGDQLLQKVAWVLRERHRQSDLVGRLGGDEFAVLLPETEGEDAREILARALKQLVLVAAERDWPVSASIGVVAFPQGGVTAAEALHAADELMYDVKRKGKNAVFLETFGAEKQTVQP